MQSNTSFQVSSYLDSKQKKAFDLVVSLIILIGLWPVIILISLLIKIISGSPVLFFQKRVGKNGKIFTLFKFRTMEKGAEELKIKYLYLNEADGPVFKIRDDPRFVGIGKILTRLGLDELPQLVNVFKDEMSLVGPRPLPISEADKLTKQQRLRQLVKPGITSPWVVEGAHNLSFEKWMEKDLDYMKNASLYTDLKVCLLTTKIIILSVISVIMAPE